jgi:peroxiredoxin
MIGIRSLEQEGKSSNLPCQWLQPDLRRCTPQACSFRDNFSELKSLGVDHVYGISTQTPTYQAEVHDRLHLSYDLLSDEHLKFQQALRLPTFEWEGKKVLKRSMIALREGKVIKWWYPVFPPDKGVDDVIAWLKTQKL